MGGVGEGLGLGGGGGREGRLCEDTCTYCGERWQDKVTDLSLLKSCVSVVSRFVHRAVIVASGEQTVNGPVIMAAC